MDGYWLWFCTNFYSCPGFETKLLKLCGSPEGVYREKEESLAKAFPEHEKKIQRVFSVRSKWDQDKEMLSLKRLGMRFVPFDDPQYPERLKSIADPPYGLFVRGALPSDGRPSVAVVGARDCSAYGENVSLWFAGGLSGYGVQIISGMARGIDGAAHRGALKAGGATFAVTGCGADVCYPESNRGIYMEMEQKGGIISECPAHTRPAAYLFPQRNRIISGLSDAVLVIEARKKSGSLITADLALEQGRDVYAAPGALGEPLSEGCLSLIRQGAGILISPELLMEELGFLPGFNKNTGGGAKNALERPENPVYSCLSLRAATLEEICRKSGLDAAEALRQLSLLQLSGLAREVAKNCYTLAGQPGT